MTGRFVAANYAVVYCDSCGDHDLYAPRESPDSLALGWVYDGNRVLCDCCRVIERDEFDNTDPTEETQK